MLNLNEFLDELDWSEKKQELFLNFDQLPPEYLNDRVLKIWKNLLPDLELFTTVYHNYEEVEKQLLKERREFDFFEIEVVLDKVLTRDQKLVRPATESSTGRVRPATEQVRSSEASLPGRVRPTDGQERSAKVPSGGRLRPAPNRARSAGVASPGRGRSAKLDEGAVKEVYRLATSGEVSVSAIAARFHISRKTVQLVRAKKIHRDLLQ